jgi:hypothetical protein
MNELKLRIPQDWPQVLRQIVQQARQMGPRAVLAFDLDSTVFDNRPRQARIIREYGRDRNVLALTRCRPEDFTAGWDIRAAMRGCGLPDAEVNQLFPDLKKYWQERFFTSEYCVDDEAIEGAAAFTHAVVQTGAVLAYVTGRHEAMRPGSVEAMRRCSLALPEGSTRLIMKPTINMGDDEFKREAHAQLSRLGAVIAAFDNEPTHANDYRSTFPQATVIHLATDHSGRPVQLLDGIISVPHFGGAL